MTIWMDVDAALSEVPVNLMPLLDDTDFKTREVSVAFNAAGMDLVWNFVTTAGAFTQTAVTPTSSGDYDWTNQGDGMYTIEIPASGGASINNDTEGFGWFTGVATGILPWRGPIIGFRAAGLNNALIDSAYSTTRGLAGTALPAAAADAAGGLPISDAGGLDLDALDSQIDAIEVDTQAIETDTQDIQGRLPAALVSGRMSSDAVAISGSTAAADAVEANIGNLDDAITDAVAAPSAALASYDPPTYTELLNLFRLALRKDSAIATDLSSLLTAINADLASGGGTFANTSDALEAIRDHVGDGTNLTEAGGDGDHLTEAGGTGDHLTAIDLPNQTMDITGNITGNLSGSVGSVTGAVGSVTGAVGSVAGNVDGNVTGSVGSLATQAKADVNAEVDGAIETYHLDHLLAATYDPASKPGAADALLNEMVESDAGVSRFTANALEQAPTGGSAPTAADIRAEIDANSTQLAAIVADTNELQTDWANGGRLDLILDARASQTTADAIEVDTQDIQGRLPAALVGGRIDASLGAVNGDATAAANLEGSTEVIVRGTVDTGSFSATTTEFEADDITEATADHYIGRIVIFRTGALAGQATDITDYALSGANGHFTVTALTEAPGNDDTFVIV